MSEKQKHSPYIDIALTIIFILIAVVVIRGWYQGRPAVPKDVMPPQVPKAVTEPVEPAAYSLEKVKSASGQRARVEPADFKEVYENFPKSDVGGNMIEGWARIKPEEKAKIRETLDKDIELSREKLRQDPEDKKTKHLLYIAETLKALTMKDFNIKPGEQSTVVQPMEGDKKMPQTRRGDGRI